MIKKNKPYQPFPEENILTKAPVDPRAAEKILKFSERYGRIGNATPPCFDIEVAKAAISNSIPKTLDAAYEQSRKATWPFDMVVLLDTETGKYTDIDGNPVTIKPRLGCNSKVWLINSEDVDRFDGSTVVLKKGKKAHTIGGMTSDGKTLEDLLTPGKTPTISSVVAVLSVLALGLIAAGAILLALYNCVAHP